ncbi:MAG: adenylate/guanylate cyclase domain-containing protein [Nitrospirae bacterium]|nr:adenylate/guanylate cyclase domain-containing protein [Nitrospirota bacterium]
MNLLRTAGKSPFLFPLLMGILVAISVIAVRSAGWLQSFELISYDTYRGFGIKKTLSDERIVLIKIREADIQQMGTWPLTDSAMAELLTKVLSYRPSVIGVDIYRDIPVPPGKEKLAGVFSGHANIIGVRKMGDDQSTGISAPYVLKDRELVGFNDIIVDPDGVVRRGLLFLDDDEGVIGAFSLLLAGHYLKDRGITPEPGEADPQLLKLGKTTFIPLQEKDGGYAGIDTRGYQYLLDFRKAGFPSFSYGDVVSGRIPADALSDRIVIIGATAESLKDHFPTPLSRSLLSGQQVYGLEIHAAMTSQLIRAALEGSRPMSSLKETYEWFWILLWAGMGTVLGLRTRSFIRFFLSVLAGLCVLVVVTYYVFVLGWWIPLIPPGLACLASTALTTAFMSYREKAERNLLMQLFSSHVSPDVAEVIWAQREKFLSDGRPRPTKLQATVFFADMKGFTSISERLDPQTLMDWLNEYMEAVAQTIILHGGIINKYIGDAVMAVFGIPVARETEQEIAADARNAVNCAIEMGRELELLNKSWAKRRLPIVRIRVGICTGTLVAGSLGSSQRMEYTVIGDTVNIASRLESYGKDEQHPDLGAMSCRILISETTMRYLGDRFLTKKVGEVSLKGREEKTNIYLVTGRAGSPAQ